MKKTAVLLLAVVFGLTALLTGCDGTKLTGGKNGIYGLTDSGMDIDQMVKAAMLTRQNEYDRMYKKEVRQEWLKEAYADLYAEIHEFASVSLSKYKMSSSFAPMQVDSSNSSVVTATANADTIETSHVVCVKQLATNASLLTKDRILRAAAADKPHSIYLKDIISSSSGFEDAGLSFQISDGLDNECKEIHFTKDEIVDQNQTLNDLASRINKSGLNIKASYDSANDSFSIENKSTGRDSRISLKAMDREGNYDEIAANLLKNLHLYQLETEADGTKHFSDVIDFDTNHIEAGASGADAIVVIDGKTYNSSANKISVSNVTYSLAGVGGNETPINVTVKMDTEKTIENVKAFVEDYNKMIDKLNELYKEEKYSDYDVLTKEEEEEMSEDQIEKWNKKAKSGLLKGNQTLSKMIGKMREAVYTPVDSVDGKYKTLMSIGITSADNTGHLQLDEDKLTCALQEDSDAVYQLSCSPGDGKQYGLTGVAYRLYDSTLNILEEMKSYAGTSAGVDGSYLGTLILNMKTKMTNFESMMQTYEDQMYKKYDAMETALSRLNAQFTSLGLPTDDAMNNPTILEEEPGTPEGEPGTPEGEPDTPEEEPGTPEEEPGTPEEEPGTPEGEQGILEEEPGTPEEEPGTPEEEPGTPEKEQGMPKEEQGTPEKKQDTLKKEQGTPEKENPSDELSNL